MSVARRRLQSEFRSPTIRTARGLGDDMVAFAIRTKIVLGVAAVASLCALPATGWAYTMEQQQACMGDAFRLCSSEIPDVEAVRACMIRRQTELSAGCRVYFRSEPSSRPLANRTARSRKLHRLHERAAIEE